MLHAEKNIDENQKFNRFSVATFPEFFEKFRSGGPRMVNVDDLELNLTESKSVVSSKDKTEEQRLDDARYCSIKHLINLVKEILLTSSGLLKSP